MTFRFTKPQKTKLVAAWDRLEQARAHGEAFDPVPVVKLFTPDAGATWLLAAMSPDETTAWGVADLGLGFVEMGEVDLAELRQLRGKLGLPVEIDRWFKPDQTLSAYQREGQAAGRLTA
jgi:hypothetical protein